MGLSNEEPWTRPKCPSALEGTPVPTNRLAKGVCAAVFACTTQPFFIYHALLDYNHYNYPSERHLGVRGATPSHAAAMTVTLPDCSHNGYAA